MSSRPFSLLGSPLRRLGSMFLAAAALAGCGGNSVVEPFQPARIVSLGDEYSYIAPAGDTQAGRKFTVNKVGDCNANRIWNQQLAEVFGFSFPQCNAAGRDASRLGVLQAQPGATTAGITEQINGVANLGGRDLVTLFVGANDIWNAYLTNPGGADADVEAAARTLNNHVLRLVNLGSKVLVLTVPDQGSTPQARALGTEASTRLNALTERFNTTLRNQLNAQGSPTASGRNVGLVLAQAVVLEMQNDPSRFALSNVTEGACGTAAEAQGLACDETRANPNYGGFLYADARYLSPATHLRIAAAAETRVRNNPF